MNQIPDLPNLLDKELAVSYNLHMSQKKITKDGLLFSQIFIIKNLIIKMALH